MTRPKLKPLNELIAKKMSKFRTKGLMREVLEAKLTHFGIYEKMATRIGLESEMLDEILFQLLEQDPITNRKGKPEPAITDKVLNSFPGNYDDMVEFASFQGLP